MANLLNSKNLQTSILVILVAYFTTGCSTNNFEALPSLSAAPVIGDRSMNDEAPVYPDFDAAAEYESLPAATEGSLQFKSSTGEMVLGASIKERSKSDRSGRIEFCRKSSAVVPNPTFSYQCYVPVSTGEAAQATYSSMIGRPLFLTGTTYGAGVFIHITERSSYTERTICQAYAKDNVSSLYACFKAL